MRNLILFVPQEQNGVADDSRAHIATAGCMQANHVTKER